jgi:hypothetical protein
MSEEVKPDIWARILATPRPHLVVPFPRIDPDTGEAVAEMAMVVLTSEESAIVTADAEKKVRRILKDNIPGQGEARRGYEELFNTFVAEGLIYTACRNKDDLKKNFFPKREAILQVLNVDELAILLNHYYTVQLELGPVISTLTDEQMSLWESRLMEAGTQPAFLLNSCSLEVLKGLVMYMASRLRNLQTLKSLDTSPLENTTTENLINNEINPEKSS